MASRMALLTSIASCATVPLVAVLLASTVTSSAMGRPLFKAGSVRVTFRPTSSSSWPTPGPLGAAISTCSVPPASCTGPRMPSRPWFRVAASISSDTYTRPPGLPSGPSSRRTFTPASICATMLSSDSFTKPSSALPANCCTPATSLPPSKVSCRKSDTPPALFSELATKPRVRTKASVSRARNSIEAMCWPRVSSASTWPPSGSVTTVATRASLRSLTRPSRGPRSGPLMAANAVFSAVTRLSGV